MFLCCAYYKSKLNGDSLSVDNCFVLFLFSFLYFHLLVSVANATSNHITKATSKYNFYLLQHIIFFCIYLYLCIPILYGVCVYLSNFLFCNSVPYIFNVISCCLFSFIYFFLSYPLRCCCTVNNLSFLSFALAVCKYEMHNFNLCNAEQWIK